VDELDNFDAVQRTVVDWIGKSISIYPETIHKAPHVIILVGPTGVGKTTTIAKLAGTLLKNASQKKQPKPSIRMITIDHTRVGAEEQLRRFGVLMDVAVDKAESAADVKQIFDTYKDSLDVLFIDTPGYSPNDFENIGKMCGILGIPGMNKDVYLTITASVKARDLVSIIQVYEQFNYDSVIITKCDETSAFGNVLSVLSEKHKPIAYITDGQQVPKKIERASVVRFLTNLNDFKIDRNHIEEVFSEKSES
jgi:flagellar biosynthesis protein FlhF